MSIIICIIYIFKGFYKWRSIKYNNNMKLIVGIGNIGKEYEETRHNIGFMVADALAEKYGINFNKIDKCAYFADFRFNGEKIIVIKPTTYVNNSGMAVGEYANFYNILPENIAVVQDDMDLPVGFIRIRKNGSSGGHNGIKSVQEYLKTDNFPRFKIGIGHPVHQQEIVVNHVLHRFQGEDKVLIDAAVKKMVDALEAWLEKDLEFAMNRFNSKKQK